MLTQIRFIRRKPSKEATKMTDKPLEIFQPGEYLPAGTAIPQRPDLAAALAAYGIEAFDNVTLIDSTRDATDVRLNYIVDMKWVLRYCSAPDMTEKRLSDLCRLIDRYHALGIQCPRFLPDKEGKFLHPWRQYQYYLSEYIDLPLASERNIRDEDGLICEVQASVARFAEGYRNVDLSETMGMYSLIDLSPFDIPNGIDEKEENFNQLIDCLRKEQENELADRLAARHTEIRGKLKAVYRDLPRCVFQGDENFTNILIDENEHFVGFIDFNLAGTEVVVNQLANLAGFDYDERQTAPEGAGKRLAYALLSFQRSMKRMLQIYHPTERELEALPWYAWIVMAAQWPTVCYFMNALGKSEMRAEILELLSLIADLPEYRIFN